MASGLLALLDDISVLMDDVSVMAKVAAKKTAGITGDDLAVNAQMLTGIDPSRELPIVWAVAKGSLINKAFLIPGALALSFFAPWSITPILMLGGAYLCFEGAEKILHKLEKHHTAHDAAHEAHLTAAAHRGEEDLMAVEKQKIRDAIRTDLILSAEIIAIALATITDLPFLQQVIVLTIVGIGITVAVYGLVGGIVKLDDLGLYFMKKKDAVTKSLGRGMLLVLPYFMKTISVVGTAAMFMVGGGIIIHGTPWLYDTATMLVAKAGVVPVLQTMLMLTMETVFGLAVGTLLAGGVIASKSRKAA